MHPPASPVTSTSELRWSIAERQHPAPRRSSASKLGTSATTEPTTISTAIQSISKTVRTLGAYVEAARTAKAVEVYAGVNGVMFDDAGCEPYLANPPWSSTQTELGTTTYLSATTTLFTDLHILLTNTYGSNPRWWDGMNSCYFEPTSKYGPFFTSMNWALSELHDQPIYNAYMYTNSSEYVCTDSLWCPGQSTSNNPNGTTKYLQIQDFTQFGVLDATCGGKNQPACTISNYHLWDMGQRGPMNALAMFYMVKNPNLLFGYDPYGSTYSGFDDYYYWVKSAGR